MPRVCFVIMPFSTTSSCTEEEWTKVFESVFKPAIEGAELDYECRRSSATRGNIVGSILQELNNAYVVIADLTDRNPNVFYELGVRHSLGDRTILLAQKTDDIPFDLRAYAYHVYDWRTTDGRTALSVKLRQLLGDVDSGPSRPDNPVSDFLRRAVSVRTEAPVAVSSAEIAYAQPLAGPNANGLDGGGFARKLASGQQAQAGNTVLRLTRTELRPLMQNAVNTLNQRKAPGSVQADQVSTLAREYISLVEPLTQKVEEFALASIEENWEAGTRVGLRLAGDWVSISARPTGQYVRLAQGVPALLAWRLLILMGAKALESETFELLGIVLREPIEVESLSGVFSNQSFVQRQDLFYPEAFLGYANYPMQYIADLWKDHEHLQVFFGSEKDYQFAVAKFLMVHALAAQPAEDISQVYPGYRLLPEAKRAMSSLCSRLAASMPYLKGIATAIGLSGPVLRETWSERVAPLNEAKLGPGYLGYGVRFPDPMDSNVREY